jgi:IstB-like ATP binding protein
MRRYERASTLLTSNRPVDDWGKLLGDTAAVTALLDRLAASCARAQMRTAQLADESADGLAERGPDEVELTSLDRPPKWPLLRCRLMAGFQMSTEAEGKRACAILRARYSPEKTMVLTKSELITSLQNEVRILLHLASKIERAKLDYRPTPKQRSTIELLKYLSMMGPALVQVTKAGAFDPAAWTAAEQAADAQDFEQTLAAIAAHTEAYARLLADVSDADLRTDIEIMGDRTTRGAFMVNLVLCSCAAYRTQLFLYLKASGREELSTMNLWAGVDAQAAV